MVGLILPQNAHYGDPAPLRRGNQLDLLVSGQSIAFPLVTRIRIVDDTIVEARIIISSRTSAAPTSNIPRGVAVNPDARVAYITTAGAIHVQPLPVPAGPAGQGWLPLAFGR